MLKTAIVIGFASIYLSAPCSAQSRSLTDGEKKLISNTYGAKLKDPVSAQYRWAALPLADNLKQGLTATCFQVNAKNSYGGFAGFKTIMGTLKRVNGKIVEFDYYLGSLDDTPGLIRTTADLCKTFGIQFD